MAKTEERTDRRDLKTFVAFVPPDFSTEVKHLIAEIPGMTMQLFFELSVYHTFDLLKQRDKAVLGSLHKLLDKKLEEQKAKMAEAFKPQKARA